MVAGAGRLLSSAVPPAAIGWVSALWGARGVSWEKLLNGQGCLTTAGSSKSLQAAPSLLEQGLCACGQRAAHLPGPQTSSRLPGPICRPAAFLLMSGAPFTSPGGIFSWNGNSSSDLDHSTCHVVFPPALKMYI